MTTTTSCALDRFLDRVRELYSLPAVAVKVLELTDQPQVDLKALKACIENDPALATKVLRVVNSSLFGLSAEVRDLGQALALLGIKPLKLLVLGFSLSEALCSSHRGPAVDRYWRHTLTQAVAAREISERFWKLPGDEAFLGGLLQDVGMLVLIQELGQPYTVVLERIEAVGQDLLTTEQRILGFDHRALGNRLLRQWALPETLTTAIQQSFKPRAHDSSSPGPALPQILRLARLLSDLVVDRKLPAMQALVCEPTPAGPLSRLQIEELIGKLGEKVSQFAQVLSFELPAGVDYRDVLVEAHRRMSALAGEVVGDMLRHSPAVSGDEHLLGEVEQLAAAVAHFTAEGAAPRAETPAAAPRDARVAHAAVPANRPPHPIGTVHFGLNQRLQAELLACREAREPLSIVLLEIDHFEMFESTLGGVVAEQLIADFGHMCARCDLPGASCVHVRHACFALLLPGCDRTEAVAQGDLLRRRVPRLLKAHEGLPPLTASSGIVTVPQAPKNFSIDDLIAGANRCLSAAQLSGGNTLKSIGIY